MPYIAETIVTTVDATGNVHIAPLGLIQRGDRWIVAPFRPSRTLDNLLASGLAVANHIDDVRVFAGCVTGRRDWPLVARDDGRRAALREALSTWDMTVEEREDDPQRPRFICRVDGVHNERPWRGFNRAQAAVIEAAVLVTRLHMLPPEKLDSEIAYLRISIDKTAGEHELEAWGWLMERVEAWRRGETSAARKM
ncbi:MAG: DUF447 family protein [Hyphomicrobiaceae bacterium]|nr:DUF447 family protein [Hyphomicrobiaceae bacterium]